MEQDIFRQEYFKIIWYLYQLKDIKYFSGTTWIDVQKSNGMSEEIIENITKSDSNFASTFVDHYILSDINFNGHCLINNIFIPKKVINLYISYTLNPWLRKLNTVFTLQNCLLDPWRQPEGSYKIGSVCPSVLSSVWAFSSNCIINFF